MTPSAEASTPTPAGKSRKLGGVAGESKEQLQHPEGPNIGYNSDVSWFSRNRRSISSSVGNGQGEKLLIALVGLPNSGKTYIARKISRYLRWISYRTRAFSIAKYRLDKLGTKSAEFFKISSCSRIVAPAPYSFSLWFSFPLSRPLANIFSSITAI